MSSIPQLIFHHGLLVKRPGVTIGNRCVIECGSVVAEDVPPGFLFGGNPARPKLNSFEELAII
jgi:acetyltransferase-like isoleucine patch superfamily enzyme